jgi:hypothetical protein
MQEILRHPSAKEYFRPRKLGRECLGETVRIQLAERLQNNDPLAHVRLCLESSDHARTAERIVEEIVTDFAERAPEQHFDGKFTFLVSSDDLVTPSGVSLSQTYENGVKAAELDGIAYGIDRALALKAQLPYILDWANSDTTSQLVFFSLCPSKDELDFETAKRLAFKPEREMSSNWLFEKTDEGVVMRAFSFDGHSLARHNVLLHDLGLPDAAESSLEEVSSPYLLSFEDADEAVETIRASFDNSDEFFGISRKERDRSSSNELVLRADDAVDLYVSTVSAVARSLARGKVTRELRTITKRLQSGFGGYGSPVQVLNARLYSSFEISDAEQLMNYLRSQALPHYIYSSSSSMSIESSGADAVSIARSYEGACPTSDRSQLQSAESEKSMLAFYLFGARPKREKEFQSGYCPCCLPKPMKKVTVKAWMGDGFIGCDDCGHVVDVCGGVYRQGKRKIRKQSHGQYKYPSRQNIDKK